MILSLLFSVSVALINTIQVAPQMKEVFQELMSQNKIQISIFKDKRAYLLGQIDWQKKEDDAQLEISGEELMHLVPLNQNLDIVAINLLNEECLWPQIRKQILTADQENLGERVHIVRLNETESLAFVISIFEDGRIAEIPLRDNNWLYIKNAGTLQKAFLKRIFGSEDIIFLRQEVNLEFSCDLHSGLQTFAEEIRHWIDFHIEMPFVGSKVFSDLRMREIRSITPKYDARELALFDYQLTDQYKNEFNRRFNEELSAGKAWASPKDLQELIPIWRKQIQFSLDRAFTIQWDTLYSYLNDPIEIRGKWQAAQVLKEKSLSEDERLSALFNQHFPAFWYRNPDIEIFFRSLLNKESIPVFRGIPIMKKVAAVKWPEGFEELVVLFLFQTKKLNETDMDKILVELQRTDISLLTLQEQLLLVYQTIEAFKSPGTST